MRKPKKPTTNCRKCNCDITVPEARKVGRYCRVCYNERQAAWRRKNRVKCTEYRKKWAKENPERHREVVYRWRHKNKDKYNSYHRVYQIEWKQKNIENGQELG